MLHDNKAAVVVVVAVDVVVVGSNSLTYTNERKV
jgi:hypothetical protein